MKLLKCKLCNGEMDVVGGFHSTFKKVKCRDCGFSNENTVEHTKNEPEILIIRKKIKTNE